MGGTECKGPPNITVPGDSPGDDAASVNGLAPDERQSTSTGGGGGGLSWNNRECPICRKNFKSISGTKVHGRSVHF